MKTEFLHRGWGRFAAVAAVLACLLSVSVPASAADFLAGAVSNFPDNWSVNDDGTSVTGAGIGTGGYASVSGSGATQRLSFDLDANQSLTYVPAQASDAGGTADVVISNAVFSTAYEFPGLDEVGGIDSQAAICVYTNTASGGALSYYGWAGECTGAGTAETNLVWFPLSGATPAEGATNTVTMSFDYTASPATVTFKIGDTTLTPSSNQLTTAKTQVSAVSFSGVGSISELAGESAPAAPSTFTVNFYESEGAVTALWTTNDVPSGDTLAVYGGTMPTKAATDQYVYTFDGWTNATVTTPTAFDSLPAVVSDTNYWAHFAVATKVAAPTAVQNLTYNGTQQTGVTAGAGCMLEGHTATAAGSHTATATLAAGYVWSDETTAPKSISWSIGTAALSVTANANSIVYGDAPAANGVTCSGFVGGDDESDLAGTLSYAFNYSQYGDVGNAYTITPSGLTSSNYAITFNAGTLTVTAKEVGLTWGTTTFGYDGDSHAPTATATGLVNNDAIDVTVTGGQTAVGTGYVATATGLTGAKAGNYALPEANTTTFSITGATIVVMPTAGQSKTYGASDPTLAYTATLGGEAYSGSFTGALSRESGENVGTYAITAGDLAATDANYAVSVASGVTFAITAAEIAVPSGSNATYDGSVKTGLAEGTGYTRGGDYTATAAGDYTATATPDANHVWVGGGTAAQNVDWSIAKATVAVAAEAKEQVYGAEAVPLTYTAGSLVAGNSFSGALAREAGDNVGTYAINIGTLSAGDNYTIDFTGANYVIVGAAITPVVSITGWTAGDTPNSPSVSGNTGNGEVTYYYSADSGANWTTTVPTTAGTYLVKASVAAAGNYAGGESDPVEFTIAEPVVPTLALAKPTIASTVLESGVAGATVKVTVDPAAVVTATNANVAFTSEGAVTNATFTGLPWNEAVDWMLQSEGAEDLPGRFYAKGETEWFNVATNALDDIADLAEGMKGVDMSETPSATNQMVRIQTCLEIGEDAMESLPDAQNVGSARTGFAVAKLSGDAAAAFYAFNGATWDKLSGAAPAIGTNDLLIVLDVEASTARYYVDGIALYKDNAGARTYALPMKASDSAVINGIGFANPDGVKSAVVAEYDVPFAAAVGDTPYAAAADGLAAADKTGVETLYLLTNDVVGTIDLAIGQSVKVDTAKGDFADGAGVVLAQSVPAGYAIKATGEGSVTNYTVDIVEYPIVWNLDLAGATNAVANTLTNSYTVANLPITLFPAGCEGYTFDGWTNNVSAGAITNMIAPGTTGAVTNWATWHQNAFTITWNIEGATTTTDVLPGVVPSYEGTPSKDADDTYTYEFAGWSDTQGGSVIANLPGATESTTYFAIFTPVYINYTIEWTDHSGTVKSETLHYGDTPTAPATAPATYVENGKIFTGTWPAPSAVSGSTSYAAVYDAGVDAIATVITIANNGATTNTVGTYASLAAAVADAPAGATVVLLADDSVSFTAQNLEIGISKALTIDGDGHTLYGLDDYAGSGDHDIYISGSDDVTIKNITLAEFGGAVPVTGRTYPIWTGSAYAGTLTLDNVTVESFNRTAFNLNGGTVVVKDCTIAGDTTKNPYFQEGIGVYNANVTVENTTITGAGSTMEKEDSQIAGCIQLGNPNGAVPGTGSVLVKSGSFTGEYGILVASNALNAVTVQGGTFNGALMAEEGEGGTIVVDGGLFNAPVPAEFAGTGLAPTTIADNDGKYTVRTARTVTFEVDNSVVYTNIVVADGEPVARPTDPTKDHYGFRAWQTNGVDWVFTDAVTADLTLVADWRIDTFTVIWLAEDGETQLDATNGIPYGTVYASLEAPAPTKPATAQFTYAFAGWTPPPEETVTSNATYTAVFTETTNKYDVIWVADGQDPVTNTVDYGTAIASIKPADPSKAADAEFTYEFSAWTPALDETVTSNATYTAVFTKTKNQYNVIWVADGSQFASNRLDYGAAIVAPAENPTKSGDDNALYTFVKWTPAQDATVTSNATYVAEFKTWAKIPVPTAETGLVYDGTTKTGVEGGTGYSLTDNTGVAASNYVATVTLADPDNTVWADDTVAPSANDGAREIAWSIAKAPMTITVAGVDSTAVYTGAEQTTNVAWTATCEGETLFDAAKVSYAGTATVSGTDVGDYLYNLDVTKFSYADNNYAATFTLEGDGKFTITPAAITITVAGYTGIYDGAAHAASAETVPADATVLWSVDGGEFTATVPSVTGVTNVTVVAKATMANYTDATVTTSLVVTAAVVDIPAAPGNKTYNGVAQTADVASADTYTVTNEGGTNAGDYTVEFALKDKANYVWSDGSTTNQTFGWSIAKAAATIVVDNASKKHGEADPEFAGTVQGLFADGDLGAVSYGRTNATEAVGVYAGVIVPTYTPNANYDVTVTPGTFAIENNEITIIWVVDGTPTTNKVEWGDMPAFAGSTDKEDETGKYAYTFTGWTPEVTNATVLATYTAGYSAAIATPLALAVADPKLASTAVDALQKTATVKAGLVGAVEGVSVKLDDNTDVPVDAATATASFSDLDWNEGVEWTMTATQTAEDASNTVETAELPGKFYAKPEKAWFSATTNDFYAVNDASDAAFAYTNAVASAEGEMVRVHTKIEVPAGGLPQAPETGTAKVGFAVLQLEGDAAPAYYAFGNGVWTKLAGVAPEAGEHDYYAVYDLAADTPTARYYIDGVALYAESGNVKTYALPLASTTRSLSGISFASKEMVKDDVVAEHDISYVAAVGQTPYTNIVDALTAAGTAGENTLALLKAGVPLDPAVSLGSGEKLVVDYAKGTFTNETPVVTGVAGYRVAVTPGEGSVTNYALDAIEYRIGYDLALEGATLPADYPTNFTVETLPVTLPIASREGYSFEGWTNNVSGNEIAATILAGTTNDVDNVARWSINDYLLTITYTGPEGFPAQDPVASNVVYGTAYSVPSPAVTGYTPDVAVVAGTMGAAPVTTNVVYAANLHKITYQITGDYFADDEFEVVENVAYGTELSPIGTDMAKEGYTFSDWAGLPEKMPDEDVVVTGSYQINSYQLKVTYVTPEGVEAPAVFASNVVYNTDYSVPSPAITGYSPDVDVVAGTMGAAAVEVTVAYTAIKYTVAFVDDDGTTVLKAATEYDYGTPAADIEKPADPTKSATAEKVYTFAGWTPAIETVTSNAVYKASYSETDTKAAVISVAQDGTTNTIYVATIADAIAAAEDGDTVQLLADVSEPAVAISDKEITLDLNGHDWTVVAAEEGGEPGTIEISGGGGVTVVDSSVGGDKGSIVSAAEPVVTLADGVTLTIRSGATIESSTANGQAISIQSGSVTVDGGIVAGDIATGENGRGRIEVSSGSVAGSIVAGDNVGVEISGGAVSGSVTGGEGDIEISGGTVAGSVTSGGWTSIYGNASVGGVVANEGAEVEISGGTVTGGVVANDGAKVEISGGTVDGTLAGTSETLVVTGGHFDNDPSDYVADGYYADGNEVEGYDVIRRIPLEGAVITVAGGSYKGTGYTVSSVDFGTTNLVIDEDCTVAYTNATDNVADNVNVGTIGVTVTGIGKWTGTVTTSFVITPATLTVTAKDATVRRGSANLPAFEYEYDGFVNGETVADLATQLSDPVVTNALGEAYSTSARTGDAFAIVPTGATAANYAITFVDGTLTVVAGAIAAVDGTEYDAIAAAVAAAGTTEDGTVVVMLDDADAAVTLVPDDVLKIQLDGFDVSVAVDDAYAARWSLVSNTVEGVTTYTLDEIKARGLMITEFDYEGAFLVFDPGSAEDLAWASDEAYCTVVTATDLTATRWAAVSGTSKLHSVWAAEAEAKVEDLDTTADVRFFRIAVTPFELTSGDTVEFAAPAAGDEQP